METKKYEDMTEKELLIEVAKGLKDLNKNIDNLTEEVKEQAHNIIGAELKVIPPLF